MVASNTPTVDHLEWMTETDICWAFGINLDELRLLASHHQLDSKEAGKRTVLFRRADFERVTHRHPRIKRLTLAGACLFLRSLGGRSLEPLDICKARHRGTIQATRVGAKNFAYDLASLKAWHELPVMRNGQLFHDEEAWVTEREATRRLGASPTAMANWRTRPHPILKRRIGVRRVPVQRTLRDGRVVTRAIWVWREQDLSDCESLKKNLEERRLAGTMSEPAEEAAKPKIGKEIWLTNGEVVALTGWSRHLVADYGRYCAWLAKGRIDTREEYRSVGSRVMKITVFAKRQVLEARQNQQELSTPSDLVRVYDAARLLGVPPETIYKWKDLICPPLGRRLTLVSGKGVDALRRIRPSVFMYRKDVELLQQRLAVPTGVPTALSFHEAAKYLHLSEWALREFVRRPHPALGRTIQSVKQLGYTHDVAKSRVRKFARRRLLICIPVADIEVLARYYESRDGKPRGPLTQFRTVHQVGSERDSSTVSTSLDLSPGDREFGASVRLKGSPVKSIEIIRTPTPKGNRDTTGRPQSPSKAGRKPKYTSENDRKLVERWRCYRARGGKKKDFVREQHITLKAFDRTLSRARKATWAEYAKSSDRSD